MPYTAEHKERTRARIVESARKLFNRYGFEQVSIETIMSEAGLTRGGFYNHFGSKDELYAAAVASFTNCNPFREEVDASAGADSRELARQLLNLYLSDRVLDDVENHCPLYALPGDVARAGLSPQRAYTDLIRSLTRLYEHALQDFSDGQQRAQAIVALCVGGMVLARTTDDHALRGTLLAATRQQAMALLGAN
jgi:TetR/AcrR family transcriptional repressor of nem operon